MPNIAIRSATEADATRIAEIYAPFVNDTVISFEDVPPSADEMAHRIRDVGRAYPYLVAEVDGAVGGYAYAGRHRVRAAYRYSVDVTIYLDPQFQGAGVGRMLYGALFERLEALEFARAFAAITLPNAASVAIHKSFGFTHIGTFERVGFKFDAWHDVSWWGRDLKA
ncbi:MAG: arsinothricin resistance N-acetyltransferase ArsN1 family B [Pseudomonadota bacterium]